MSKRLFAGNLDFSTTEHELRDVFGAFGNVVSAKVITDRETGQSRGFGFIEFEDDEGAKRAVSELDGSSLNGRSINVNEARERGSGGGGFRGGGGRR
jgi:RNA recognition motif-containing protein